MSVFKPIEQNNISIIPFETYKQYDILSYLSSGSYGIISYVGEYKWHDVNQSDLTNTVSANLTTSNEYYKYVLHNSLNNLFYSRFDSDPISTVSDTNPSQSRYLNERVNILSIPQKVFGEKIKRGSLNIIDNSICGTELIYNSDFSDSNNHWYTEEAGSGSYSSFYYSPIIYHTGYYSYATESSTNTHVEFVASKIVNSTASLAIEYIDYLYISASLNGNIENNSAYKLAIDIDRVSYNGLNNISELKIAISGCDDCYIPLKTGLTEIDITSNSTVSNSKIEIVASASINVASDNSLWWQSQPFRVRFNKISLKKRNIQYAYVDDSYGNIVNSSLTQSFGIMRDNEVGVWDYNDGYIDERDERRGNYTKDKSIYRNNGICTNVKFIDSPNGKSAYFNHVQEHRNILTNANILIVNYNQSSGSLLTSMSYAIPGYIEPDVIDSNPLPLNGYIYCLSDNFHGTSSLAPTDVSVQFTNLSIDSGSLNRVKFLSRHSYSDVSAPARNAPNAGISIISASNTVYSESFDISSFWETSEAYFTVTESMAGVTMSINMQYPNNLIDGMLSASGSNNIFIANVDMSEVSIANNVRIYHNDFIDFHVIDNFAIESMIKAPSKQHDILSGDYNTIISKIGRKKSLINVSDYNIKKQIHDNSTGSAWYLTVDEQNVPVYGKYPYRLCISNDQHANPGKIIALRNNGTNEVIIMSSSSLNDNAYHHVIFQKSGSNLELYIDGLLESSASDFCSDTYNTCNATINNLDVNNDSDIFIASDGDDTHAFTGIIDYTKIYSSAFISGSISEIAALAISGTFDERIGNVFYEQGMLTITSPEEKYKDSLKYTGSISSGYGYNLQFNNTVSHYELEVRCVAEAGEFNKTLNRTTRRYADQNSDTLACFATHSDFSPYVTTVGLYNENAELVALGKLSKPIKKYNNIDTTYIIRLDL